MLIGWPAVVRPLAELVNRTLPTTLAVDTEDVAELVTANESVIGTPSLGIET